MTQTALRIEVPRALKPLLQPARYKAAYGGRGGTKSWFFANLAIARHIAEPGLRTICLREIQRSLEQSVKRLLEDRIEALGVSSLFEVKQSEIVAPGGGIIYFRGMQNHTADSIKSLEGYDIAWVEEAQSLSQFSLDLLRPTIRKPGSELWFSWNPLSPDDPVDKFFRGENAPEDAIVVETSWRDNPWLPKELRDELERDYQRDPDRAAHVWGGSYRRQSEARVFRNWRVAEFETPGDSRFYFGADWGYGVDPTVLVRCWMDGRKLYVDREAYMVGCELDFVPFLFGGCEDEDLRRLNAEAWKTMPGKYRAWPGIEGARSWPIIADSASPERISFLKRHGFPKMTGATKGAGSVEEGIEFLRSFDIVVHPRCKHTIRELSNYSYKVDKQTEEVLPVLEDKENHVIDSLRYAVEKARRAKSQTRRRAVAPWVG